MTVRLRKILYKLLRIFSLNTTCLPSCSTQLNLEGAPVCYNISDLSCDINTNSYLLNKGSLENLKGFRIAHLNITSIPKYIDQLRLYLANNPVDILSVNETRLDDFVDNAEVHIQGPA